MNAERLMKLVESLKEDEEAFDVQSHLNNFISSLQSYSNEPSNSGQQIDVVDKLHELSNRIDILFQGYDPPKQSLLREIGAMDFFGPPMIEKIRTLIDNNPMTPAVVHKDVSEIGEDRQNFLSTMENLSTSLSSLGFEADDLEEGEAEIGFQLPRSLFENSLSGLIGELRVLQRIIRAFSEAVEEESPGPIEVRQISTTDPIFFFSLDPKVVVCIGGAVTWALHTWEKLEQIRLIRKQAQEIDLLSDEETEHVFDGKINKSIESAIKTKVIEILGDNTEDGRVCEQAIDLDQVLRLILQRVERGMSVELRFLPSHDPQEEDVDEETEEVDERSKTFEMLKEVSHQLIFPAVTDQPILKLTKEDDGDSKNE